MQEQGGEDRIPRLGRQKRKNDAKCQYDLLPRNRVVTTTACIACRYDILELRHIQPWAITWSAYTLIALEIQHRANSWNHQKQRELRWLDLTGCLCNKSDHTAESKAQLNQNISCRSHLLFLELWIISPAHSMQQRTQHCLWSYVTFSILVGVLVVAFLSSLNCQKNVEGIV